VLQQYRAECDYAKGELARLEKLRPAAVISEADYLLARKAYLVACAQCEQTEAEKRSRAALGTLASESELAERQKELAGEEATLSLLQAGSRPEEIEAAQATVTRLREEVASLNEINNRLTIQSPIAGTITTRRLKEKIRNYFEEGDLVCEVEDAYSLEVLIVLYEDQATRVRPGQKVRLKARSLPFDVLEVEVERIAPCAEASERQSTVNVYCWLDDPHDHLRSGMTGYARIRCGRDTMAFVFTNKCLSYIRTEFWW